MKNKTCCFTGHRIIQNSVLDKLNALLDAEIENMVAIGIDEFVCGGAVGFDMIASDAVLRAKKRHGNVKLVLALPCPEYMKGWKADEKARMDKIISAADEKVFVSPFYTKGCMHIRNRYMVSRSSICIAYMRNFSSGTGFTVACAKSNDCTVVNLADRLHNSRK